MKTHNNVLVLVLLCLSLCSCEKYLDIKSANSQAPVTTVEECQQLLNNLDMNYGHPLEGLISGEEFYLKDSEYNSEHVPIPDKQLYTWNSANYGGEWTGSYAKVYMANVVLESLDKIVKKGGADLSQLNNVRGQAMFLRAFSFWQLAQLYTQPYTAASAGTAPGIPLRLASDINDKSTRGTLQQTYDRILQDLSQAAELLEPSFIVPTRPTKAAAYAMLARVYQGMEDYPKALDNANLALTLKGELVDFNTLDTGSTTPFVRYNPEIIYHAVSSGATILNPQDFARTAPALHSLYGENDLRKDIWFNANMTTRNDTAGNVIVDADGNPLYFHDGTYRFAGNYELTGDPIFFVGLAVDEVLLIRAESYARAGNVDGALGDLNRLLQSRWNTHGGSTPYVAVPSGSAGQVLERVILERRKELVFRGMRWNDLRRLNKDAAFAQTISRTALGLSYSLPANDPRYTLLIPQNAINRAGIEQNPR